MSYSLRELKSMSSMRYSQSNMMTLREMIDEAIIYDNDEPIVDFKMLETILFIIARHLNLLTRKVKLEWAKLRSLEQSKANKKKKMMKTTIAVTEIKVHRKITKEYTTTESTTDPSTFHTTQHKRKRSRQRSRSKSQYARARYSDEDDEELKKRGRSKGRDGEAGRRQDEYNEGDDSRKRHGPHGGGYDDNSKQRGGHGGEYDEHTKRRGRHKDRDEEDSMERGHRGGYDKYSKQRGGHGGKYDEYTKKRGKYNDRDYDDSIERGHRGGYDKDSKQRGGPGGEYDDYTKKRGRYNERDDDNSMERGHRGSYDKDSKQRGGRGGESNDYAKKRGRDKDIDDENSMERGHKGAYDKDSKMRGRYKEEDSRKPGRKFRGGSLDIVQEKILVVSRSEDSMQERIRDHRGAVVTQDQFDSILAEVRELQNRFGVESNVGTGWSDLHKPTTLTDPKAALNMAARLDAAHKKINQMMIVVTKFASKIPGINVDAAYDDSDVQSAQQKLKEFPKEAAQSTSKTISYITENEEVILDDFLVEDEKERNLDDLATWKQLQEHWDEIQKVVCKSMATAVDTTSEKAKRANQLLKISAPKVSEAQLLNIKFARLRILVDRFSTNANEVDVKMTAQMGECQDRVSQMQFEVETMIERIDELLAHPAEDPLAVAAIKDDFAVMTNDLVAAQRNQEALKELHEQSALEFETLKRKLEMISQIKTTTDEALDVLKTKARVTDVNSLLSRDQLYAVVGHLQQQINRTNTMVDTGEVTWQNTIDDHLMDLRAKGERMQLSTLNQSLVKHIITMDDRLNIIIDIVGGFPVLMFKKKLDRDGNCLCCGLPAKVKLSAKYLELAKRLKIGEVPTIKPAIERKSELCVSGRPIPHSLDPRALICDRFCGATISKTGESLSSMGLGVRQINRTQKSESTDIDTGRNLVNLTCAPCTQSEECLF